MVIEEGLLNEREKTHGDFERTASMSCFFKSIIMAELEEADADDEGLTNVQHEALDMICTKIARIVCGNPNCKDHWDDIAGYAQLAALEITSKGEPQ